jgi:hypothetical protein
MKWTELALTYLEIHDSKNFLLTFRPSCGLYKSQVNKLIKIFYFT